MKAILIDPYTETVSEVEHTGDYRNIYELLSDSEHKVSTFTVVGLDNNEAIYVDDNGLLGEPTHFFQWKGYPQPLAGRGLILGGDDEGETVATTLSLDYVKSQVKWANDIQLDGFRQIPPGTKRNHPAFGEMFVVGHTPVFSKK